MPNKKVLIYFSFLLVGVLLMAACTPRVGGGDLAAAVSDQDLLVDLPAITLDIDADGNASMGGVAVGDLGAALGVPLDSVKLDPSQVQTLVDNNIQHIQISTSPTGLTILVNGQAIPSLQWDSASLASADELLANMNNESLAVLQDILPKISDLGIGVTLRFPLQQGAEPIPAVVSGEGSAADAAAVAQANFLKSVGGTPAKINIPIAYDDAGVPQIGGMSGADWAALTGIPLDSLQLSADRLSQLTEMGIAKITLATDEQGIHISINDKQLPYISWDEGKLQYAMQLGANMGLLGAPDADTTALTGFITDLLPMIQTAQFNVEVTLPTQ
ncbi:MAG: hypothetical protein R3C14_09960 [Caldilineaceae bacterium]